MMGTIFAKDKKTGNVRGASGRMVGQKHKTV